MGKQVRRVPEIAIGSHITAGSYRRWYAPLCRHEHWQAIYGKCRC